MLKTPRPTTLRELIPFLSEQPNVTVQSNQGRRKIRFENYEKGTFRFNEPEFNFNLHDKDFHEVGLTIGQKGVIVVCGDKSTTYYFGKSADA